MNSVGGNLAKLISLMNFRNPSALYLGAFIDMVDYIKYLQIVYPPRLQLTIDAKNDLSFNILPDVPQELAAKFPDITLPAKFQQYGLTASFFVNYWNGILTLLLSFLVLGSAYLMKSCTTKYKTIQKVCNGIISSLKWNFIVISLLSCFGQIVLYTSMELRTTQFYCAASVISFLVCLVFNLATIFVLIKMLSIIYHLQKTRRHKDLIEDACRIESAKGLYKDYCIIFDNLKDASAMKQAFTCIYCVYIYLFYATIAYLFAYPLCQTVIHVILTFALLLYLMVCWPQKERIETIKLIVQSMIMLVINVSVLNIAYIGYNDDGDLKASYGNVVIVAELMFGGFSLMELSVSIIVSTVKSVRLIRDRCRRRKLIKEKDIKRLEYQGQSVEKMSHDESTIQPIQKNESSSSVADQSTVIDKSIEVEIKRRSDEPNILESQTLVWSQLTQQTEIFPKINIREIENNYSKEHRDTNDVQELRFDGSENETKFKRRRVERR